MKHLKDLWPYTEHYAKNFKLATVNYTKATYVTYCRSDVAGWKNFTKLAQRGEAAQWDEGVGHEQLARCCLFITVFMLFVGFCFYSSVSSVWIFVLPLEEMCDWQTWLVQTFNNFTTNEKFSHLSTEQLWVNIGFVSSSLFTANHDFLCCQELLWVEKKRLSQP